MASRMMHLAMAEQLITEFHFQDPERFKLGALLPDASSGDRGKSHFCRFLDETRKRTYDLTKFRGLFWENVESDDLYLGYYLHLIQDMVYRRFLRRYGNWKGRNPDRNEQLYRDYALLNAYVKQKYGLTCDVIRPKNFQEEKIYEIFPIDLNGFLLELQGDFLSVPTGECVLFTPEMADEYIVEALSFCRRELTALREGRALLDETEFTWGGTENG